MAEVPADLLTSPLHARHLALGAKLAEFGGWLMPLEYTGAVNGNEMKLTRKVADVATEQALAKREK